MNNLTLLLLCEFYSQINQNKNLFNLLKLVLVNLVFFLFYNLKVEFHRNAPTQPNNYFFH